MKLNQTHGRKSLPAAFTMAEVLVATVILSTIALAYYGALSQSFSVVQSTREDLRATQILMQKLEAIRLCRWDQLTNFSFREPYDPLATNQSGGAMYYGTVTTNTASSIPITSSYQSRMCLVTVSLSWTNSSSPRPQRHNRQMQTQVARYGMQNYIWGAQ